MIGRDEHGSRADRLEDFGDAIPPTPPTREPGLADGRPIEVAGTGLEVPVLRDDEAIETALLQDSGSRTLFLGGVVDAEAFPVLDQGGLEPWIAQVATLRACFPEAKVIAPDHGRSAEFDVLLAKKTTYLTAFRDRMREELWREGNTIPPDGVARIQAAMAEAFPDGRTTGGVADRFRLIALDVAWTLRGRRIGAGPAAGPEELREA